MDKIPDDLRRRYRDLHVDSIPAEILKGLDRSELEQRLAHAQRLHETGDGMNAVDRTEVWGVRDAILKALPRRQLAERIDKLAKSADACAVANDRADFRKAISDLKSAHPQPPVEVAEPVSRPAPRTAPKAAGETMIFKAGDVRNDALSERDFRRVELQKKAERYEQTSDAMTYSDRELSKIYREWAADARQKLARGDY